MAEYEEEGQIIRLEWTCPACENRNPGGTRLCSGCGTPMEAHNAFALAAAGNVVTDEAELERARRGPDVHCGYCQARNPAGATQCTQCGGPMDAGESRKSGRDLSGAGTQVASPAETPPSSTWTHTLRKALLIGAAISALLLTGLIYLIWEHEASVTVSGLSWTTEVQYEEHRLVTRNGWKQDMPSDARILSSERRVHHTVDIKIGERNEQVTERVQAGTTRRLVRVEKRDQGNGYAKEVKIYEDVPRYENRTVTRRVDVTTPSPVHDLWCRYEARVWEPASATLSGTDSDVRWPEVKSALPTREKARIGTFEVTFTDGRTTCTYSAPNEQDFVRFRLGSAWKARVNNLGVVTQVL